MCYFLSGLLAEGGDSTMARSRRGRATPQPQLERQGAVLRSLLLERAALQPLLDSIAYDVAVHQPPQRVAALVDCLQLSVYAVQDAVWEAAVTRAFQPYTLPPAAGSGGGAEAEQQRPALMSSAAVADFVQHFLRLSLSCRSAASVHAVKDTTRRLRELVHAFSAAARRGSRA